MKKPTAFIVLIALASTLFGCGEKLNGHSEKEFENSRKKVEAKLSKEEKNTLEKAMRVIVGESMRLKFVEPKKYKGQSFSKIALSIADGQTYSSIVDKAEDILQEDNKREIKNITTELDSLERQRANNLKISKYMSSLFTIDYLSLEQTDFFNVKTPTIKISYKYTGQQPLRGQVMVSYKLYEKGKPEPVFYTTSGTGDENSTLQPGDSVDDNLILSSPAQKNPQLWSSIKYPLKDPNWPALGLKLEVQPVSFTLEGKQYLMPTTNNAELTAKIKKLKTDLADLKELKGKLDEYDLTEAKL